MRLPFNRRTEIRSLYPPPCGRTSVALGGEGVRNGVDLETARESGPGHQRIVPGKVRKKRGCGEHSVINLNSTAWFRCVTDSV